jgi:hypothetical protein
MTTTRRRRVFQLAAGLLASAALTAIPVASASASTQPTTAGQSSVLYLSKDRSNAVLVPLPGVAKSSYDPNLAALALGVIGGTQRHTSSYHTGPLAVSGGTQAMDSTQNFSGNNNIWTCPPGGSCANTNANFSSTAAFTCGGCWTVYDTLNGHTRTAWLGCCPFNADAMYLADTWKQDGISVSVSFPAGAGFSGSGDTANWSASVSNNWQIDHYYNGLQFYSGWALGCVHETASGTSQFGSSFYTTNANGQACP